ncbi:unnamed protein product [Rhizophagus irregularis]|uniref:Kinase-like protein n=1 Tax=Rhizophagus irregularis TaxID=588596 RepID=A0A2N1MR61_9GLOM|nr:kinase-like protein [Rhizophagus irregularis]CAB4394782.1 unnamed protein product [Rhizophagus irregularis]CAB5365143.1 unnamed protein product [Rhizophagus irregularis]
MANDKFKLKLKTGLSIIKRIIEIGKNVPLIQTASAVAEQIQKQIEIQVDNEEMWADIKERVCTAQEQLSRCNLDERKYNRAYKNYIEVLKYINLYMKEMGNKESSDDKIYKKLKSFVNASHINEVYKELLHKLDDATKEFHFEINIETYNKVDVLNDKVDIICNMMSLAFLNKGFDPNPKDVNLTKLYDNDIEDPENDDKDIRGDGRVEKKYYNGETVALIKVKYPQNQNDEEKIRKSAIYHLYLSACNSILRFKGTLASNRSMYIVIEWAEYGYLELFLQKDIAFPWSERIKISQQIASAIQFCHNNHILHHNLRSKNVLIDKDLNAKLTGFESAKFSYEGTRPTSDEDGIRYYPIERFGAEHHLWCKRCDIYSFSVLLWEIASRKKPFEDITTKRLIKMLPERLRTGEGPGKIDSDIPLKFKEIIDSCGSLNQKSRPEIKQVSKELNSLYLNHGK